MLVCLVTFVTLTLYTVSRRVKDTINTFKNHIIDKYLILIALLHMKWCLFLENLYAAIILAGKSIRIYMYTSPTILFLMQ